MKRRILFVIIPAIAGIIWFMLASKFESAVRATYLPILQEQQERGIIDLDPNNIEIHKYRFTVVAKDFTIFPKSTVFQTKLDKVSAFFNPITRNVSICSSGKKLFFSSGSFESYIDNPSFSIVINESVFTGTKNNFHISFSTKEQSLKSVASNSVLVSDDGSSYEFVGKLDEQTNQYSLKLTTDTKGTKVTRDYFKWSSQLVDSFWGVKQEDQQLKDFLNDLSADYYYVMVPGDSVNSNMKFTVVADKNHLGNIYKFIKGRIQLDEMMSNLVGNFDVNKELFVVGMSASYGNSLFNNKLSFDLSGDGKEIKGNLNGEDTRNYPEDKKQKIVSLTSEFLAKLFNKINANNPSKTQELTADDFTDLSSSLISLKSIKFNTDVSYKIQDTSLSANLHTSIDDYNMNMSIESKNQGIYKGIFTLSDPFKLINAKTKFAHEVLLPLLRKATDDTVSLSIMQRYVSNIESNGFEALKVLNKTSGLVAGDKFEAEFSFEPKNFDFRINDKLFFDVITNEKIAKFLNGFTDQSSLEDAQTNAMPHQDSVSTGEGVEKAVDNDSNKF